MKIFMTSVTDAKTQREYQFPERYRASYLACGTTPYTLVESAEAADLIVYWKFWEESQVPFAQNVRAQENFRLYPEKCYVVTYEDEPIPFFPGVYTCLVREKYDPFRHRTGCYGITMNPFIPEYAAQEHPEPTLLASFTGALSHPLRQRLVDEPSLRESCQLGLVPLFFYYNSQDPAKIDGQRAYARQMAESKFALCPRGSGASSHRLFEAMQMGRCPVIIADDWVPPEGPAWSDCALRVADRNIPQLHAILRDHEPRWAEMGRAARRAWEQWFSPEMFVFRTLQAIVDLHLLKRADEREFQRGWDSLANEHRVQTNEPVPRFRKLRRLAAKFWRD
jgi:hypothetical protein